MKYKKGDKVKYKNRKGIGEVVGHDTLVGSYVIQHDKQGRWEWDEDMDYKYRNRMEFKPKVGTKNCVFADESWLEKMEK